MSRSVSHCRRQLLTCWDLLCPELQAKETDLFIYILTRPISWCVTVFEIALACDRCILMGKASKVGYLGTRTSNIVVI